MEMTKRLLAFLPLAFAFVLCFAACADSRMLSDDDEVTYCIAKPPTDDYRLNKNIEFCCNQGINCAPIQPGGICFYPNTTVSHASYAMNLYYKAAGKNFWDCDFGGSGLIISRDPSYGPCVYQA